MAETDLKAVVQRMIDAGESEDNIATVIKSAKPEQPFVPATVKDFLDRVGSAAVDVPIGMVKGAARMGQMIPGMSTMTDKVYGLPSGMSEAATQPRSASQEAGGYLNDAALLAATGGAEAGPAILSKSAGYISNPTVAEQAANMGRNAASFGSDTVKAIGAKLASGGPVTPDKVAGLIVKYGKDAVKGALIAGGGYGAWSAVRHLF